MAVVKQLPQDLHLEKLFIDFVNVTLIVNSSPWSINFFPKPEDPHPTIYYTAEGNTPNPLLPRQVRWQLAKPLDSDKFLLIVPKVAGTNIFHLGRNLEDEIYRLDNDNPTVLSGPARRGPGPFGSLGWVYGVVLMQETSRILSYPPEDLDGLPLAYLDPVVVIKEEP